jgi:hypothetical protein
MQCLNILLLLGFASTTAHAALVSVNLTRSGAPTETGFTNWATNDNTVPGNLLLTLGTDNLTLSAPVSGINAGTSLRSIDRGGNDGYAGPLASLSQTWWGQRQTPTGPGGYITINISGLSAGNYSFTSWHLDHEDQTGGMKVEFSNNGGGSFTDVVAAFDLLNYKGGGSVPVPADNAAAPYEASFNFVSTGADVQVRFTNVASTNSSEAFSVTNGFQLTVIPEPSSSLLVGLAAGFGLLRRRRH